MVLENLRVSALPLGCLSQHAKPILENPRVSALPLGSSSQCRRPGLLITASASPQSHSLQGKEQRGQVTHGKCQVEMKGC